LPGRVVVAWSEDVTSPLTITEIDHVVLRCRDQERMLRFYTDVLGLPEERRLEAIGLVQLRAGRSLVDFVPGAPAGYEGANVDHVCLLLAPVEMESVLRWLAEHGVETVGEPMVRYGATGYGLSIYVRDPEGNVVELKVPADGG
jgi:catechol 2,3-dioxygenase-like lactoylglutathione lyase family enzyme